MGNIIFQFKNRCYFLVLTLQVLVSFLEAFDSKLFIIVADINANPKKYFQLALSLNKYEPSNIKAAQITALIIIIFFILDKT